MRTQSDISLADVQKVSEETAMCVMILTSVAKTATHAQQTLLAPILMDPLNVLAMMVSLVTATPVSTLMNVLTATMTVM